MQVVSKQAFDISLGDNLHESHSLLSVENKKKKEKKKKKKKKKRTNKHIICLSFAELAQRVVRMVKIKGSIFLKNRHFLSKKVLIN